MPQPSQPSVSDPSPDPSAMLDLASTLEARPEPVLELFHEAWRLCRPVSGFESLRHAAAAHGRYVSLCRDRAWLEAALSLVPDHLNVLIAWDSAERRSLAVVVDGALPAQVECEGRAESPSRAHASALAVCAAALRARARLLDSGS